jgi:oligosaccharide repeat unit polymerase
MNTDWTLAAMFEVLIVIQAWLGTIQAGSWLAPGPFYSILWASFIGSSLIFAPDYKIWPGVVWFFLMNGMVQIGAALGGGSTKSAASFMRPRLRRWPPSTRALRWTIAICCVLGIVGVQILLRSAGEGLSSLLNPEKVFLTGMVFSYLRYKSSAYREPAGFVIFTMLLYLAGSLAGVLFALSRHLRDRLTAWLIFVPTLLIGITLTTRAPVLLVGINWVSAYLSTVIWYGKRDVHLRLGLRTTARVGIIAAGLVAVYVGLGELRSGIGLVPRADTHAAAKVGLATAKSAYMGSMAVFSRWFEENWDRVPAPTLGAYTFASALQWLHPDKDYARFEEQQVSEDPHAPTTNVCTIYRVLGEDFTLPGSALLLMLLGLLGGWAYRSVRQGAFQRIPFLAVYYQIAFVSLTGFSMRETTLQGALVLFLAFVRLGQRERHAAERQPQRMPGRAMPEAV